jgi:hypothetical protein
MSPAMTSGRVVIRGIEESTARQASWGLLVLSVVAYMTLSPQALFVLGIPYDVPTGSFPAKIHPGTYLMLAAWAVGLASHGNPLGVLAQQARQHRLLFTSLACMVAVFAWAAGRHGPAGLAFIVDTLWMPAIGALTLLLHSRQRQRQMLVLALSLLLLNAALAIGEAALRQRLVPLFAGREGIIEEDYFRSSALQGHPLSNALTTVALLPAVLLLPWRAHWRAAAGVLLGLGLLTFGSRSALAGLLLYLLLGLLPVLSRTLRGGYGYTQITGGLLGAAVGAAALAGVVAATGLGERIFKNLTWDNSAQVRVRSWDVLQYVRDADLWFGIAVPRIDSIALRVGIDPRYEAIENFWLYLLLLLGVAGMVVFVVGLGCLLLHLWRLSSAPIRAALVIFLVLASGANTLASKSTSLLLLTLVAQCAALAPRPVAAHAAGSAAKGVGR